MKITSEFSECEHEGDYENYAADLISCGAKIVSHEIDDDEESVRIIFEVEDLHSFKTQFAETDSFGFWEGWKQIA